MATTTFTTKTPTRLDATGAVVILPGVVLPPLEGEIRPHPSQGRPVDLPTLVRTAMAQGRLDVSPLRLRTEQDARRERAREAERQAALVEEQAEVVLRLRARARGWRGRLALRLLGERP